MVKKYPRYKVMHITAPSVAPNQGDVDYTNTLTDSLKDHGVLSVYPLFLKPTAEQILSHARKERVPGLPLVAHVHLRPPNGGTLLTPQRLQSFDKLVVTVHEFIHLRDEQEQALNYIRAADHVIFSTPYERDEVRKHIPDIDAKSSVIPIFPSIEVMPGKEAFSNAARPPNIVHFSSIRAGKGHGDLIRLGMLIKEDPDLKKYQEKNGPIKIYMVGNPTNPRLCVRLIGKIYGVPDTELPKVSHKGEKAEAEIADFIKELEGRGLKPQFPIEIVLNTTPEGLQDICRDCNFAYLPLKRGATHHSTALPALMSNGCVAITTMGGHTPDSLKHGAVVFADSPDAALKKIKEHIQQPQKNTRTRRHAAEYVDAISADQAALAHASIYNSLVKRRLAELH